MSITILPIGAAERNSTPLGERVILSLLSNVKSPAQHTVTFDNFFTSYQLIAKLNEKHFFVTGTIRENRCKNVKVETVKTISKKERGFYDFKFDVNNNVSVCRWNDNSVVTILSNHKIDTPVQTAKRYDKKKKVMTNVAIPDSIVHYNQTMGGVDLFDNAINNYRISVRGKKWYWVLFTNGLDAAMTNAWKLHCVFCKLHGKPQMSQLDFRVEVTEALLLREKTYVTKPLRCTANAVRYDGIDHFPLKSKNNDRRRCKECGSQTCYTCSKCNVYLHSKCFTTYHSK